ncbi:hypothetical protein, conserved [Leishmania tarentolae]|uniref:Uncharacterized protein n=1 Tax=Leishmania tarentolae TaxID=5689 RepID=A0A640KRI4_LEITA|nr:hypothetical protein, conserved [Leishmania tarentolae]GET91881.1 hypothetical protein, conserved [Leishmania tarentolae]
MADRHSCTTTWMPSAPQPSIHVRGVGERPRKRLRHSSEKIKIRACAKCTEGQHVSYRHGCSFEEVLHKVPKGRRVLSAVQHRVPLLLPLFRWGGRFRRIAPCWVAEEHVVIVTVCVHGTFLRLRSSTRRGADTIWHISRRLRRRSRGSIAGALLFSLATTALLAQFRQARVFTLDLLIVVLIVVAAAATHVCSLRRRLVGRVEGATLGHTTADGVVLACHTLQDIGDMLLIVVSVLALLAGIRCRLGVQAAPLDGTLPRQGLFVNDARHERHDRARPRARRNSARKRLERMAAVCEKDEKFCSAVSST